MSSVMKSLWHLLKIAGNLIWYTLATFSGLCILVFGFYFMGLVELDDQLVTLVHICFVGSIISGALFLMQKMTPVEEGYAPRRLERVLIPGRTLPSNHSRKAPPAVDE